MFKPVTVIAGFQDMAVVSQSIQQGRGHLWVDKDLRPFREVQVGGDDQAGLLIEFTDQMEQ